MAAKKKATKPSQAYKGNGQHAWEEVVTEHVRSRYSSSVVAIRTTRRLRVPGGYLYRVPQAGVVFVPMPGVVKHKV